MKTTSLKITPLEFRIDLDKEYLDLISSLDDELTSLKERNSVKYEELFGQKELACLEDHKPRETLPKCPKRV